MTVFGIRPSWVIDAACLVRIVYRCKFQQERRTQNVSSRTLGSLPNILRRKDLNGNKVIQRQKSKLNPEVQVHHCMQDGGGNEK